MQLLSQPRIAVLGAGHVGPVIARMAIAAGFHVSIAASGDPEKIELMTSILVPGAEPRWAADAVADADIVVLSLPLHRFADLDPGLVAGKLVVLFEEKVNLFAELLKGGPVTWEGTTRAALINQDVVPHVESGPFPVWIGVGGSPQSVVRAAHYGFNLMLAIIGGNPSRFAPFSRLYDQALKQFGQTPRPVGVHGPGHVAATDEKAREEFWPYYEDVITRIGKTRGFATPTKEQFLYEVGPHGALYIGSPETVAQKIAANLPALGATRFDLKYGMGGLSHEALMTNIELYGTKVIPRVRELLAESRPS